MSDDVQYLSAAELVAKLQSRELSAVEALDALADRVDRRNPEINVVVTTDLERARDQARAVDQARAAGYDLGPLAGLPMTVKDSLMTEGMRTTSGAPELSDLVPDRDAAPVARLRQAGAVIYGKTNLPIYAGDVQSYNEVFGTSNNPWDISRSVGGSSGGSAGALAAGFTPLEVGSDIGGSIRNPAGMCGVVGHKPSYGIVSAKGQIPGPPGTLTQADIAVVGPMARTVGDCRLGLDLLAGADDWHRSGWSLNLPPARGTSPEGLRVAIWANDDHCPVDPEIEAAITVVGTELASAGAIVDADARPEGFDFAKADAVFGQLLGGAMCGGYPLAEIEKMARRLGEGDELVGDLGVEAATQRHRAWLTNNERRLQMRARWRQFFEDWDVVLAPISPTVAIPHDHSAPMTLREIMVAGETRPYLSQTQWMGLFGVVYLPATAVPIAVHSNGLPIGVQVVGPFLEDQTCLAVAECIETISGGTRRPPGW
ncbi:MAG: amidase [Actinomycetia bacterium]|nr:amidase [Actinomycetes bacterium]MCP5035135.1 amidase [Actinomycetes bacterium]